MNWQAIFGFWTLVFFLVSLCSILPIEMNIDLHHASKKWRWLYAISFIIALIFGTLAVGMR